MDGQGAPGGVVVIGGGMAGLSVACYLGRAGVPVTLFEKAPEMGGRAATQEYAGYCFNRGIHALYGGGAAERGLRELGIPYTGRSPKGIFLLRQGKLHVAPYTPLTLMRADALGLADKLDLIRLFARLPRIDAADLRWISVQEWLERNIRRPLVRQLIAAVARTNVYSAALDLVSAEVNVANMQLQLKHPILYLDGGWQTLVEGLRRAAERAGARLVSGARVTAVEHHDGRVHGVRLRDGTRVPASAVVVATAPRVPRAWSTAASFRPSARSSMPSFRRRSPASTWPCAVCLMRATLSCRTWSTRASFRRSRALPASLRTAAR